MIMKNPSKLAKEFMENGKLLSTPVIDAHTHMGPDSGADMPFSSAEQMIEVMDRENIEITDCIEGCLIDSLLLYDNKANLYYMCMEYAQNEWTSCYKVSCGNEKIIYQKWDSIKESMEVA